MSTKSFPGQDRRGSIKSLPDQDRRASQSDKAGIKLGVSFIDAPATSEIDDTRRPNLRRHSSFLPEPLEMAPRKRFFKTGSSKRNNAAKVERRRNANFLISGLTAPAARFLAVLKRARSTSTASGGQQDSDEDETSPRSQRSADGQRGSEQATMPPPHREGGERKKNLASRKKNLIAGSMPSSRGLGERTMSRRGKNAFRADEKSMSESAGSRSSSLMGEPSMSVRSMSMPGSLGSSRSVERNMSRRARNTFRENGKFPFQMSSAKSGVGPPTSNKMAGYMKFWAANTLGNSMEMEDSLSSVILESLSKKSLCDVEIIGKDGVPVESPSYLLAAHSEVFQEMFYSDSNDTAAETKLSGYVGGDKKSSSLHRVVLAFATWDAIEAAVHFLATHSLPGGLENEANEFNIRSMCQIHLIGRLFKITSLVNQAYRTARLFMNKMPRLVCAAFDECNVSTKLLSPKYCLSSSLDELKAYTLYYMRESPLTTLLSGGTVFLNAESIEAIICDQDMDVDEHTMFNVLSTWVKQDEDNVETGKTLVSNINLSYIKTDYLKHVVKKCSFVDLSDVEVALKEIEEMLANQSPDEKEHVLVEGAGKDEVNGIYVRMEEDIGLGGEEVMFIKEAQEDEYFPDYGLYLLRSTWSITSCVDYSNILYSCEVEEGATSRRHQAPKHGWETIGGGDPPPICTWNPSKDDAKTPGKVYVAPNLTGSGTNNIKGLSSYTDIANGDHDDGCKRLSLMSMLNLPTDEGHEDDDYHDDNDDSNTSRDI